MDEITPEEIEAHTPRRRRWDIIAMVIVCALLVAGFGVAALLRQAALQHGKQAQQLTQVGAAQSATPISTTDWKVYHDPLNVFSMRLPPGWTDETGMGTYSDRGPTGSDSGQTEGITFHDQALGAGSAAISVYVMPIHNTPFAHSWACSGRFPEQSIFNGYPADEREQAVILFESGDAHFQIDEVIPGVLVPMNPGGPLILTPPPTPTQLPASTVSADRALIDAALATFQPTDPKPLVCP